MHRHRFAWWPGRCGHRPLPAPCMPHAPVQEDGHVWVAVLAIDADDPAPTDLAHDLERRRAHSCRNQALEELPLEERLQAGGVGADPLGRVQAGEPADPRISKRFNRR